MATNDNTEKKAKPTSATKAGPKVKKARKSKFSDKALDRAIELRKTEGLGLVAMTKAITKEFKVKAYPSELLGALKRRRGIESMKTLERAPKTKEAALTPAGQPTRTRKSISRKPVTKK